MAIRGRIIKGIAGFYYVATESHGIVECHAKGIFRKEQLKPLVGDWVGIEILDEDTREGSIVSIEARKNRLIRPDVANVDQALVIFAHSSPDPNLNLLDKFLIMMEKNDIPCLLCFNKEDLVAKEQRDSICKQYVGSGAKVFSLQANLLSEDASKENKIENKSLDQQEEWLQQITLEELKGLLQNRLTVLAGPSGVGKSTLINGICPEAQMETGAISRKLERGKHTTRHSELFQIDENTYMMDTPGFTAFTIDQDIEKEDLKHYYPEFYEYEGKCKFQGCTHTHEPNCAVKIAVGEDQISKVRYEGYVSIFEELKARKKY